MFSYNKDEKSLCELKEVLFKYYCQKASEESKRIWEEKNMSNELMHELLNTHQRTPYKRSSCQQSPPDSAMRSNS